MNIPAQLFFNSFSNIIDEAGDKLSPDFKDRDVRHNFFRRLVARFGLPHILRIADFKKADQPAIKLLQEAEDPDVSKNPLTHGEIILFFMRLLVDLRQGKISYTDNKELISELEYNMKLTRLYTRSKLPFSPPEIFFFEFVIFYLFELNSRDGI